MDYQRILEIQERRRVEALTRGDDLGYLLGCMVCGTVDIEAPDRLERGAAELIVRRKSSGLEDASKSDSNSGRISTQIKKRKIDYGVLLKAIESAGGVEVVKPGEVFAENRRPLKEKILGVAGYTHVYGEKGLRIPLSSASDARIGKVFKRTYRSAFRYFNA